MRLAGLSPDGTLVEIVESKSHPWFVGAQFHPEFKSRPNKPHPLFRGFVAASLDRAVHCPRDLFIFTIPLEKWEKL